MQADPVLSSGSGRPELTRLRLTFIAYRFILQSPRRGVAPVHVRIVDLQPCLRWASEEPWWPYTRPGGGVRRTFLDIHADERPRRPSHCVPSTLCVSWIITLPLRKLRGVRAEPRARLAQGRVGAA
jgi:hypothetical protein